MRLAFGFSSAVTHLTNIDLGNVGSRLMNAVIRDGYLWTCQHVGLDTNGTYSGDTLQIKSRNPLGESISATPAIVEDTLYVRTDGHLWAFGR